jgi:hypothetical protein
MHWAAVTALSVYSSVHIILLAAYSKNELDTPLIKRPIFDIIANALTATSLLFWARFILQRVYLPPKQNDPDSQVYYASYLWIAIITKFMAAIGEVASFSTVCYYSYCYDAISPLHFMTILNIHIDILAVMTCLVVFTIIAINRKHSGFDELEVKEPDVMEIVVVHFKNIKDLNKHNKDSSCSICYADYGEKDTVIVLANCSHYFHKDCINSWIAKKNQCPVCRAIDA